MRAAPTPMPTPISSATLLFPPWPPELEAELVVALVGAEIVGVAMKGNFDEEDDLVDKGNVVTEDCARDVEANG